MGFSVSDWRRWRGLGVLAAATLALGGFAVPALAHVGSPDIYVEGNAGPYRLLVTVRPPLVIPGIAEIEVRASGDSDAGISGISIAPIPLTGEASKHPPVADAMKPSAQDKQFFTGALWIMASGSWQVRFTVDGKQGTGVFSVPVPATASSTRGMQAGLGILLGGLGLLLVAGVIGIVGAAARDAQLAPGEAPTSRGRKRAWIAMSVALVAAVVGGKIWWDGEADDYAKYVYKPLTMDATLTDDEVLHLKIQDPGWLKSRKVDDFVLDHDHLMHLYLIREPGMDVVFHLHPVQVATGEFQLALPSVPAGDYRLYADVVHATGFPETLVARMTLPEVRGRALAGDDAQAMVLPVAGANAGTTRCPQYPALGARFRLPDGYTMVWENAVAVRAKTPEVFAFSLLDGSGKPAQDMTFYMGMLGHAAFVKEDGSVFAHVHPSGTASMAALMMAAAQNPPSRAKADAMEGMPEMEGMDSHEETGKSSRPHTRLPEPDGPIAADSMANGKARSQLPNSAGFPYGFPTAGAYRIFVQMKHGQTVETGAFDACATAGGN